MNEQSTIPVGSKITTQKEYPACVVSGREIYGYLPAGATGEVVNHTADGRAMILFDGQIHTFEDLGSLTVEPATVGEQIGVMVAHEETDKPVIMVNLNHPCYEIDVYYCEPDHVPHAYGQGYLMLSELRHMKECIVDLRTKLAAANDKLNDLRIRWGMNNHE